MLMYMKKLFFSFGLFLTVVGVNAQHMSAGLTLGTGTCWMSNTGQNVVHKESCNIGGTFVYSTDAHWGFAVDVKYSREGYKYTYNGSGPYYGQTMDTRISS